MKKTKLAVALLAVMCIFAFSACGASFDPVTYVQGSLDAYFHDTYSEEYIDMLGDGSTEQILRDENQALTATTVQDMIADSGIYDADDELTDLVTQMIYDLYGAAKYEVGEATETEGGYTVEVTAYPLISYTELLNDEDGTLEARINEVTNSSMSDEEYNTIVLTEICKAVIENMKAPTYGDPETVTVSIYQDADGLYTISESSIIELENIILDM